jgi:molybdenum cofactor cytidylyltransferase
LNIVGLLLAAGSATRFGSDKLAHRLPHGVPIAVQAARHLHCVAPVIYAAVKPGMDDLALQLKNAGCQIVVCESAAEGMGASLADMPFVRTSSIAAVRDALAAGAPLAAPYWRARRGHPVGVSGAFFDQLLECRGDEGARGLLRENEKRLLKIPVGDPGVLRDIDTPEDLMPPLNV